MSDEQRYDRVAQFIEEAPEIRQALLAGSGIGGES